MNFKSTLKLSFLTVFVILLLQGCDDTSSFGEDLEGAIAPTDLSYPEILNAREFSYIESSKPFINTNGRPVTFEIVSIKKDEQILDESYMNSTSIVNPSGIESNLSTGHIVQTSDMGEMGKVIIAKDNPFSYGDYYFTIGVNAIVDGKIDTYIFKDVLHLNIGPKLAIGISYCPFKINLVNGESTESEPAVLFEGNTDVRYELGSDSDKLSINASTGAISMNPSYSASATETINPIINVVSNITEESVSFEGTFTAVISATPVELEKEKDYFFFPKLKLTTKNNVNLGGDGYSHQVVKYHTLPEGNWFNTKALWRNKAPVVNTPDAVKIREEAGVSGTQTLEHSLWTLDKPSESWIVIDPVNLALYEGCFDSKAVFWYSIFLNDFACYQEDGRTPIGLEVHITNNYTGDVTTTDWTQVNDVLECEINNNGTIFTGTPYPGDQTGPDPDGLKDPAKNANNLWVRSELNLEDYKQETNFTIAFRLKTYFDTPTCPVNGIIKLSNVHFVASEK